MSTDDQALGTTTSLCPTCLEPVPGTYEHRDGAVYLTRDCAEHGVTSRRVWGDLEHWEWASRIGPDIEGESAVCCADGDCGPQSSDRTDLSVDHDHTCVAIVEVTQDCNLSCSYCFAGSGPGGKQRPASGIVKQFEAVVDHGGARPLQLSGGEPTVRNDLPELVSMARDMGIEHVQVNTNGLRLARDATYAEQLADAGVTALYLQFDGVTGETYEAIREVDLWAEKQAAVEAARDAGLSVVLVPTVVPGVNDDEMGDVVRFALDNLDVVSSVNFQPVAQFGRLAERRGRFSLDRVAERLASQLDGFQQRDFLPVPCCSSYCQLTAAAVAAPGGPRPLTSYLDEEIYGEIMGHIDEVDWMELLAGTQSGAAVACDSAGCCGISVPDGLAALAELVLTINLTGFMDADAADVDRLENCCLSVVTEDGDLVPFCGYTMTTDDGEYAMRNRHDWGGRPSVGEPVPDSAEWVPADDD